MALGWRPGPCPWDIASRQGSRGQRTRGRDPGEARGPPVHVSPSGRPNGPFPSLEPCGRDRPEISRHRTRRPGRGTPGAFPLGAVHTGNREREVGPGGGGGFMQGSKQRDGLYPWGVTPAVGDPRPHLCCFPSCAVVGSEDEAMAVEVGGGMHAAYRCRLPLRGGRSRNTRGPIVRLRVEGMMDHGWGVGDGGEGRSVRCWCLQGLAHRGGQGGEPGDGAMQGSKHCKGCLLFLAVRFP